MQQPQQTASAAPRGSKPRTEPAPLFQRLIEKNILEPSHRVLCYGCGRGVDVAWLRMRKFKAEGYDPYPPFGYAEAPEGKYDLVFMIYLMARLKTDARRAETIATASQHVRPGGYLIINSRNWARLARDAGKEGRQGAIEHFTALMAEGDFDRIEAPPLDLDDASLCVLGRKAGVYAPQNPIVWVDTQQEMTEVCQRLQGEPFVALDVETTLDEPPKLCTVQLGIPGKTWILDALAMDSLDPLKALMEDERVEKVIHNAWFEEQTLGQHRIKIHNVFDTLAASRRKHKRVDGGHKIGEVCERELGIYLDKAQQTSDWTQRPLSEDQMNYAAIDAEVLVDLFHVFKPPKAPENLELF